MFSITVKLKYSQIELQHDTPNHLQIFTFIPRAISRFYKLNIR